MPPAEYGLFESDVSAAGLTSLGLQETSDFSAIPPPREKLFDGSESPATRQLIRDRLYQVQPITGIEEAFRHSGWKNRRALVVAAMERQQVPVNRLDRFTNCGSGAQVFIEVESGRPRLTANYCHDRCCQPCGRARAIELVAKLMPLMDLGRTRFLTLTRKHVDEPLAKQLNDLLKAFKKLRKSDAWKKHVNSGGVFIEIKRSKNRRHWHPHLHVLIQGSYWPQVEIEKAWSEAVGAKSNVFITAVKDSQHAADYCAKYCTKPLDATIFEQDAWLDEAMIALKGKRLFQTFGDWYNLPEDEEAKVAPEMNRLCSLDALVMGAAQGSAGSFALLRVLTTDVEGIIDYLNRPPDLQ